MKKNTNKKFETFINSGIDQDLIKVLKRYWSFDGSKFQERIGEIVATSGYTYHKLYTTINESSKVVINDNCGSCGKAIEFYVNSQKKFLEYVRCSNNCFTCQEEKDRLLAKERKVKLESYNTSRYASLEKAIDKKVWTLLTPQQNRLLLHFIQTPSQDIFNSPFENLNNNHKNRIIERCISLGLLDRGSEYDLDDTDYGFSPQLPARLKTYLKSHNTPEKEHFSKTWSRISFELKKNKRHKNRDTPLQSGTITFKEDVFIKAGTKCIYSTWSQENQNVWLSITPISDIITSENTSIEDEPEPLKSIIKRF